MEQNDGAFIQTGDNVYIDIDSGSSTNYFEGALRFRHGSVTRFAIEKDNVANADLYIRRYNSSGVLQDSPMIFDGGTGTILLNQRIATTTVAGSSMTIDATTWQYGEGLELKYNVADWADTYTLTEATAGLFRMETNEASTNSIYGTQSWGVTNNVNIGSLWGGLAYAYVKGASAKTITNVYAFQPEISFDAGSGTNTITDACVVRAKVTGGVMSDYTVLDGFRLTLGDMDGGSRTYGNGIILEDDSAMSGTSALTTGLNITIATTTGISISGATTTAIATSGTSGSASGRVMKGQMTVNNANYGDGYGLVESELTLTGTCAGHVAALTSWVNIITGTAGSNMICAQSNGVYEEATGTLTGSTVIFGMRMQSLLAEAPSESFPFSCVSNTNIITALFSCNAGSSDMGTITDTGADTGKVVPLYKETSTGTTYYVRLYAHS